MASNVSTVDGMGFEEVNQESYTEIISGTNVYGHDVYGESGSFGIVSGAEFRVTTIIGTTANYTTISGTNIVNENGKLQSVSIDNATQLFGYRIKAGSVLMGDSISGLISFPSAGSFSTINYFLALTPSSYGVPQWSRTGSQAIYCVSGAKRASGCWIVGGSATVVDWIAVGV